jgi:putative DNA primase/helicase
MESSVKAFAQQRGITITTDQLNTRTDLLNLPNGTLNLETGELFPNNPNDLITQTFGAELDEDAQCPQFEQFMQDAVPDPAVRGYVQRALGYSLLGRPVERAMFMLHGPSGTGKSVMTSVMTQMFGDYGATAPASTFRQKQQEASLDLHMLRSKRFVATSEMPEGVMLDEELVKRVTGGDMVTTRGLYERYQDWRPRCVVWIATNFLPKVNSDDNAIWRRAKTIKMPTEFGADGREEILGYADVLIEERNGILNWLLAGLADYHQRGLDEPSVVTQEILAYRTESDTVASFIRDRVDEGALVPDTEEFIKSSLFFGMYQKYCQEGGGRGLSQRRFAHRLRALGYEPIKVGGVAGWKGLIHNPSEGFGLF